MTRHVRIAALRALAAVAVCAGAGAALSGCVEAAHASTPSAASELRLGYFDDVTHAPALVGVRQGIFARVLGDTKLSTEQFSAGPTAIEALNAGAIDAAFVGPSPALNSFVASGGRSLRIVAGATSGGAALVVRKGIDSVAQLRGTTIASPQLGNTQDVALRTFLAQNGLSTSLTGSGEVHITPTSNAQTLQAFEQGRVDGAWVPEPWVSRLVSEAGGHVLVDEGSQWPGGDYPTTVLVVSTQFLAQHPETVAKLVDGEAEAVDWLNGHTTAEAGRVVGEQLVADGGAALPAGILSSSLDHVSFSLDPFAATFPTELAHSKAAGITRGASLDGLFDLSAVNAARATDGEPAVSADGLGRE